MVTNMQEVEERAAAKRTMLARARNIKGFKADARWSLETLAEKVEEALLTQEEKSVQDILDASDTWVYLNRGAWPTSYQKHLAGEVIKIPEKMADEWTEAGACRPATKKEIADATGEIAA